MKHTKAYDAFKSEVCRRLLAMDPEELLQNMPYHMLRMAAEVQRDWRRTHRWKLAAVTIELSLMWAHRRWRQLKARLRVRPRTTNSISAAN